MSLLTARNAIGFTKPPRGPALWFTNDMSVRLYSRLVTTTTLANSTAQTTLASFTVPALSLTNQGGVRAHFAGTLANATSTGTVTLRAKLVITGTTMTVLQSPPLTLSTSTSPRSWNAETVILGTTNSTDLRSWSYADLSVPSALATPASTFTGSGYKALVTPNSTAAGTLTLTAQFSVAAAGVTASRNLATLETLA